MLAPPGAIRPRFLSVFFRTFSTRTEDQQQKPENLAPFDRLKYADLTLEERGIEESDGRFLIPNLTSRFCGKQVGEKQARPQYVWVTEEPVSGSDIERVFRHLIQKNQAVHINTGSCDNVYGVVTAEVQNTLYTETGFLKEDTFHAWKAENASFHTVSRRAGPIRPENANHVIDVWHDSARKTAWEVGEVAAARMRQVHSKAPHPLIRLSVGKVLRIGGVGVVSLLITLLGALFYCRRNLKKGYLKTGIKRRAAKIFLSSNRAAFKSERLEKIRSQLDIKREMAKIFLLPDRAVLKMKAGEKIRERIQDLKTKRVIVYTSKLLRKGED